MEELLDELLIHHLKCFANKLGVYNYSVNNFDTIKSVKLLNYAEVLSRRAIDNRGKYKCLMICGLIWEYRNAEWNALSAFLTQILIRLDLPVTAQMINWIEQTKNFGGLGSIISELTNTALILQNEVLINQKKILLTGFQLKLWQSIDEFSYLGVSAPTSAGKSFVICNKIADILLKKSGQIVYVVPTISLINQVYSDLKNAFKEHGVGNVDLYQSYSPKFINNRSAVFVLTQERAQSIANNRSIRFDNFLLLVIDEIQNIERNINEGGDRAKILFDVIQAFKTDFYPKKIIILGPRISNIDEIVQDWFGNYDSNSLSDELPPVLNFTYSFAYSNRKLYLKQFNQLGQVNSVAIIDREGNIKASLGKTNYTERVHSTIMAILYKLSNESGVIVFSKSSGQANKGANEVMKTMRRDGVEIEKQSKLLSLRKYVADTVHPLYSLFNTLEYRVAYHHGKMPYHIRWCIEYAFKTKLVNKMFCTSTLLQGVNLPAKYLIIRNPELGYNNLTSYEFANLRGRAGRLLKDFIGYTIVIDDNSFEQAEIQLSLSDEKSIKSGYSLVYSNFKADIEKCLLDSEYRSTDTEYTYLVIYIRQTILKYGERGLDRLRHVGIDISYDVYEVVIEQINNFAVERSICVNNPYWDPVDLNRLFLQQLSDKWPVLPSSSFNIRIILNILINNMKEHYKYYYDKYFKGLNDNMMSNLCLQAEQWAQGLPLRLIIDPFNWPIRSAEDIDFRIDSLSKHVVFGLPKLLRPLVQMQSSNNPVLSFIEIGTYDVVTRAIIEIGLSRETAVRIVEYVDLRLNSIVISNADLLVPHIKNRLRLVVQQGPDDRISEWDLLQIEDIL